MFLSCGEVLFEPWYGSEVLLGFDPNKNNNIRQQWSLLIDACTD